MKILVYGAQQDEKPFYEAVQGEYGFSCTFAQEVLSADTVHHTKGYDALIIVTTCKITHDVANALRENGVRFLAARSAGVDHIDFDAVRANGLRVANVPFYSPSAIAEHTILTALNVLRHSKREMRMLEAGDFTMSGLKGKELGSMTAGVYGTGRIGLETIKLLHGFGCRILAYDLYPNEQAKEYCSYQTAQEVLQQSDIVFLHCPLTEQNHHLINGESILAMKDGAYLINTARGGLVDCRAVLEALQCRKLAGFGFDVWEDESVFLRKQIGLDAVNDPVFLALLKHEDAYYTAHIAFYTDLAIERMIRVSLDNLKEYEKTGECKNEVWKKL